MFKNTAGKSQCTTKSCRMPPPLHIYPVCTESTNWHSYLAFMAPPAEEFPHLQTIRADWC